MKKFQPKFLLLIINPILIIFLFGCSSLPYPENFQNDKHQQLEWVKRKDKNAPTEPRIGLALAGGGTRAAQFSMGVLKGLHQSGVLNDIDIISSVSGGTYAAYSYISWLTRYPDESMDEYFADCIPSQYKELNKFDNRNFNYCPSYNQISVLKHENAYSDPYRFQNHIKTHIDIFSPEFSNKTTGEDRDLFIPIMEIAPRQVFISLLTEPLVDFAFDWNINFRIPNFSSSYAYLNGIKKVWGFPPEDCGKILNDRKENHEIIEKGTCWDTRKNVKKIPDITFAKLREAYQKTENKIPYWIINATTPVLNCESIWYRDIYCTFKEMMSEDTYPPHKAGFEITPIVWGSGEHNFWLSKSIEENLMDNHGLNVSEVVGASAAFFDPYEKTKKMYGFFNFVLKALGFKWGYYIPNPNVMITSPWERNLHKFLPFPFYLFHGWQEKENSMDIHLIDGGQNENLGVYPLIRRRVPNIIIADHASENISGNMEDICNLKKWLKDKKFARKNNNRIWWVQFDSLENLDQVCNRSNEEQFYDVYSWKNPILKGCAVEFEFKEDLNLTNNSCETLKNLKDESSVSRSYLNLYLIKLAMNIEQLNMNLDCLENSNDFNSCLDGGEKNITPFIEILGFLQNNLEESGKLIFPTHSTISLTLDSSPYLFGAYRALGMMASSQLMLSKNMSNCFNYSKNNLDPQNYQNLPDHEYLAELEVCNREKKQPIISQENNKDRTNHLKQLFEKIH